MENKKVLTIQDLSCYGQCSLTVALPILSALGHETIVLPTQVLSTHTSGFKGFEVVDLSKNLSSFVEHWKKENIKFSALYTGYLGSIEIVNFVKKMKEDMFASLPFFFDPAFADKGKLYGAFNQEYVKHLKTLIPLSDFILPNITEACFLTNTSYKEEYDISYLDELVEKLVELGAKNVVITDVRLKKNTSGVFAFSNGEFFLYEHEKIGEGYHGTGDIFASTFVGEYLNTSDTFTSSKKAALFVYRCIKNTIDDENHKYGVKFEPLLKELWRTNK